MILSKKDIKYPIQAEIIAGFLIVMSLFIGFAAYSHDHKNCQQSTHFGEFNIVLKLPHEDPGHTNLLFCLLCDFIVNLNYDISKHPISIKLQEVASVVLIQSSNDSIELFIDKMSLRGPPLIYSKISL
jgi:hypothetical protein